MSKIIRHIITDDYMQMIPTRSDSIFLNIKQQNLLSPAELYILQDDSSPEVLKPILVLTQKQSIGIEDPDLLEFIGTFNKKGCDDLFMVFELK